jgi:hypothetical protein
MPLSLESTARNLKASVVTVELLEVVARHFKE